MTTLSDCCRALDKNRYKLLQKKNVVGVAVSSRHEIAVYVSKKESLNDLKKKDVIPVGLKAGIVDVYTDVIQTGPLVAYRTDRVRPAPPGVSIGHKDVTAGTFGCVVKDKDNDPYILSNNHVLANSNDASLGENILQPGKADGGSAPDDVIAELFSFVPLTFDDFVNPCPAANLIVTALTKTSSLFGRKSKFMTYVDSQQEANLVDAAIAAPRDDDDIVPHIIDIGTPVVTLDPSLDLSVIKSGRTTGLTSGKITGLNATVRVQYGAGKIATFEDQIILSGDSFSGPGDSGSVICHIQQVSKRETQVSLVGLLFGGGEGITIANKISHVFDKLGVTL